MYKIENERFEVEVDGSVHSMDPWDMYRGLYLEEDITVHLEDAESDALPDEDRREAVEAALAQIRRVSKLAELGAGECIQLIGAFVKYVEDSKKKQAGWLPLLQTLVWDSLMMDQDSQATQDSASPSSDSE